ncbi:hypothetical protein BDC45DRAFT_448620 [Circinella umbellata]|nr:hypothetical protein BDC45DRAFT_448620 [Circinella umbellata]
MAVSLLFVHQTQAAGPIAQVIDANNFCTFLPPADSSDRIVSNTEWNARPFCMGNTPAAIGAGKIPDGLIQSAHFVATDDYVQVTGQIDPSKGNLDITDWGGQYDIKAPNPSECAGYKYYVNLIEPASYTYCIRCCNTESNCNRGISEKGCDHIIGGDYSGPISSAQIQAGEQAAIAADAGAASGNAGGGNTSGGNTHTPSQGDGNSNPSTPSSGNGDNKNPATSPSSSPAANKPASSLPAVTSASSSGAASSSAAPSSASSSASSANSSSSASSDAKSSDGSVSAQSVDEESAAITIRPEFALLTTLSIAILSLY